MPKFFVFSFLLISTVAKSQTEITWSTLDDVTFTDKYSEEAQGYYYYPDFGGSVKALEGNQVLLKGYMLVIDPASNIYILSRYPYASCFFCGSGGPESIVELQLKPDHPKFKMDQIVTILGTLALNYDDIYQCNYILTDAEVYEK
ncbi:MAG: DUF3299 domain-containing protein [Bacteroidota bacterium]